ncbi:unnamed protein product, partial [Brenthis ino]
MNMRELKLKQDVSTRWNSTYDMLDRVVKIKDALIATLALVRADLALSLEDWTLIEKALPILKIFYEVTVEVSAEKSVSLSKVIVYCRLLKRQITYRLSQAEAAQDNSKIYTMLRMLNEQLHRRFNSVEGNTLYAECDILDPRFKGKGVSAMEEHRDDGGDIVQSDSFDQLAAREAGGRHTRGARPRGSAGARVRGSAAAAAGGAALQCAAALRHARVAAARSARSAALSRPSARSVATRRAVCANVLCCDNVTKQHIGCRIYGELKMLSGCNE